MEWEEISRQVEEEYHCTHDLTELRGRRDVAGREVVVKQCVTCGTFLQTVARSGLGGKPWSSLPAYDEDLRDAYAQRIRAEKDRRWAEGRSSRRADYDAYLQTPHWRALRRRVIERDNGLCQGCLEQPATEVHHLTYVRRGHEMAFDLVSLCRRCHEALSIEEQGQEAI